MKIHVSFVLLLSSVLSVFSCKEEKKPVVSSYVRDDSGLIRIVNNRPLVENGKYVFFMWGFPDFEWRAAADSISKKWNIVYEEITGCLATYEEADCISAHNKQVEQLIEKQYGKGWKEKYEREIDEILKKQHN